MKHILLLAFCVISLEAFIRFRFIEKVNLVLTYMTKVISLISSKKVSDHWKEIMVPSYALSMMKNSLFLLLQLSMIIILFLLMSLVNDQLISYSLSIFGIIESIIFISIILVLRKTLN